MSLAQRLLRVWTPVGSAPSDIPLGAGWGRVKTEEPRCLRWLFRHGLRSPLPTRLPPMPRCSAYYWTPHSVYLLIVMLYRGAYEDLEWVQKRDGRWHVWEKRGEKVQLLLHMRKCQLQDLIWFPMLQNIKTCKHPMNCYTKRLHWPSFNDLKELLWSYYSVGGVKPQKLPFWQRLFDPGEWFCIKQINILTENKTIFGE